jgi:tetratricopeptide (TPR) repeat protein
MNDLTHDDNGSPAAALSEQGQRVRDRFEAACQTQTGGPLPDLDSFLRDAPVAERNALRSVLESIQQNSCPAADGGTMAWAVDPTATDKPQAASDGGTIDLPPPGVKTLNRAPDQTAGFASADPSSATGVFSSGVGGTTPTVMPGKRGEVRVEGYEILGELGRGGMGVVYKARQIALNRLVALKMVLAGGHASPDQLARFKVEALAVAKLQHPNIVQIYEISEQDGLPYFSLEFVDGGCLSHKVGRKPQPPEFAARMTETLARAMHFAHSRGIVHRDLKPANVLLTADGQPKITDFGLAKAVEEESSTQTRSGVILGTPAYMAPEQARGETQRTGPLADLYALGAILYDLLTGRPPFQGATMVETIDQVLTRDPVPPAQLGSKVPADLETICLKCLQKEPTQRYGSAGELADDLKRFLNGEPIMARPVGRAERLWRWCKRNPRVAIPSAVAAAMFGAVAVGSPIAAVSIYHAKEEAVAAAKEADQQKEAAEQQKKIAEQEKEKAVDARKDAVQKKDAAVLAHGKAVDPLIDLVYRVNTRLDKMPAGLRNNKDLLAIRDDVLNTTTASVRNASKVSADAGVTPFGMLVAHLKLGPVYKQLWQVDAAVKQFQEAIDLGTKAVAKDPNSPKARGNLALAVTSLGDTYMDLLNDGVTARKHYERAVQLWGEAADRADSRSDPSRDVVRLRLTQVLPKLVFARMQAGDPRAAIDASQTYLAEQAELNKSDPRGFAMRRAMALHHSFVADSLLRLGDVKTAVEEFDESLKIWDELSREQPQVALYLQNMVLVSGMRGDASLRTGDAAGALPFYKRALDEVRKMSSDSADVQGVLASTLYRHAAAVQRIDGDKAAEAEYRESLQLREPIALAAPDNLRQQALLMLGYASCGQVDKAVAIAEKVERGSTPASSNMVYLAGCYALCVPAIGQGKPAEAMTDAEKGRRQAYVEKAIALMRQHMTPDRKDLAYLASDPDLDPIRQTPEFKKFLAGYGDKVVIKPAK